MIITSKPKSIDELMSHLRNDCHIKIEDEQRQDLINYGYFHGYKGYRFYQKSTNKIPYTDFKELVAVIEYDNHMKAELYSSLMLLETAIKNIVCNIAIGGLKSDTFEAVYKQRMNDNISNTSVRAERLKLRNSIYSRLTQQYSSEGSTDNRMVRHFLDRGDDAPLWAIFELLYLSDLAFFFDCLNLDIREKILKELKIFHGGIDTNRNLLSMMIYTLKGLRNAVAHNGVIFDTRFKKRKINKVLRKWLEEETAINNITLNSLADYIIIIICCLLIRIDNTGERAKKLLNEYESENKCLKQTLPENISRIIIQRNISEKLEELYTYFK